MKLTTYTVEKTLLRKTTLKSVTGSYNSDENGAKVIMTFEAGTRWVASNGDTVEVEDVIDTNEANRRANVEVRHLLDYKEGDDWLKEVTHDEPENVPTGTTGAPSKGKL